MHRSLEVRVLPDGAEVGGPALVRPSQARSWLGRDVESLTVDLRSGLDLELLGIAHGLVRGGGRLVLVLPEVLPGRTGARLARAADRGLLSPAGAAAGDPLAEQDAVVAELVALLGRTEPARIALIADRGRGKSAAVGRALAAAVAGGRRAALTGPDPASVEVASRFSGLPWTDPAELLREPRTLDLLAVDEAARLTVPVLRSLAERHPDTHQLYSSTTHGYEGTGRGFALRFLPLLDRAPHGLARLTLTRPVRWTPADALERWTFDLLLLDAEPAPDAAVAGATAATVSPVSLDRDALAADERLLRELFGLLVHAHYRTTPSDLQRLLDASGLHVHALLFDGHAVGACLAAEEGGWTPELSHEVAYGAGRIRGHALADTLVCHGGRVEAGPLSMIRSVRTVIHPALQGRGLARVLVEHVHRSHQPDLFGTLFGADVGLVRFRQALGYRVVRLGASAGTRTGLPSAVMVRAETHAAHAVLERLTADLARDIGLTLTLTQAEGGLAPDPALVEALTRDLPSPSPRTPEERDLAVRAWATGPRPFEAAAGAVREWLRTVPEPWPLEPDDAALLRRRGLEGEPWWRLARDRGESVRATMRALRRAARALLAYSASQSANSSQPWGSRQKQ